jgi:hypothetical protein
MNLLSACLHKKNTAILTPIRLQTTPSCDEKSEPLYAEIETENQYPVEPREIPRIKQALQK